MKVRVVALGQRMPGWVTAGFDEYAKRLPREWSFELVEIKPEPRDRGRTREQLLEAEAPRVTAACSGYRIVALDERGAAWTTREFAAQLARRLAGGDDIGFVIGSRCRRGTIGADAATRPRPRTARRAALSGAQCVDRSSVPSRLGGVDMANGSLR